MLSVVVFMFFALKARLRQGFRLRQGYDATRRRDKTARQGLGLPMGFVTQITEMTLLTHLSLLSLLSLLSRKKVPPVIPAALSPGTVLADGHRRSVPFHFGW